MVASAVPGLVKDTASGAQAGGRAAEEILALARAATGAAHRAAVDALPGLVCAGVERAIRTVEQVLEAYAGTQTPVYVRKQIVHNSHVVAGLRQRGAIFVDDLDDIPADAPAGTVVVFSAHGVSPAVREQASRRGFTVADATCPLVTKVHSEAPPKPSASLPSQIRPRQGGTA